MSGVTNNQVIIVGAGPGGLLLAGELAMAGVPCTVLEKRSGRSAESRALGLQARTLELLQLRGLAQRFTSQGNPLDHFRVTIGKARIELRRLETKFQQLSILPQSTTEKLLEERAIEHGASVKRSVEVVDVHQDSQGVTLSVRDGQHRWEEHTSWVVGCDGSHSTVRNSVGINFTGTTYPYNVIVGDVRLAKPPQDGMLVEVGHGGLVVAIDFGTGWWRMGAVDWNRPKENIEPPTLTELQRALATIFGYDITPHDPLWITRFRFQKRHASTYRRGRVLLLGDAAHVHAPLGAQGLNMSLQDAMNLGWKLAAVCKGEMPQTLLDTYEQERRPVATRVLKATDFAIRVMMSRQPFIKAARRLVIPNVLRTASGHKMVAEYVSGLAWKYPPSDGRQHVKIVGHRIPDAAIRKSDGSINALSQHFESGKFVLIDQMGGKLTETSKPWGNQLVRVQGTIIDQPGLRSYQAILCRPDGYCAWAGELDDTPSFLSALKEWRG
jgi:2-polyprenyl-6-methoxyphenol hydroxylase-like FAD-dependent oxidoreductase